MPPANERDKLFLSVGSTFEKEGGRRFGSRLHDLFSFGRPSFTFPFLTYVFIFLSALIFSPAQVQAQAPAIDVVAGPGHVAVIPIKGTIDFGMSAYVTRSVQLAEEAGAGLIILEINTFGGLVEAATDMSDAIITSDVLTVAFVRERAWSAGALIALAADTIWMTPGSSIGAAEPRPADEKTISALRAQFASMAERAGRDSDVAAAMVDAQVDIESLSPKGTILTLTAARALEVGYSEGTVTGREPIKEHFGVAGRDEIVYEMNWAERLARFLTAPLVSEILLTIAFLALIAEVTSPGLGIPGIAGLTAFALFFGGRYVVGIVGAEAMLLFVIGIVLLTLEIFVTPGFGVPGIIGTGAIFASLYLSFGSFEETLRSLGIVFLATTIGGYLLWRFGKRRGFWNRIILTEVSPPTEENPSDDDAHPLSTDSIIGARGVTLTVLRPAGIVLIEGERVDAISEGGYIQNGKEVIVVKKVGQTIVVRET